MILATASSLCSVDDDKVQLKYQYFKSEDQSNIKINFLEKPWLTVINLINIYRYLHSDFKYGPKKSTEVWKLESGKSLKFWITKCVGTPDNQLPELLPSLEKCGLWFCVVDSTCQTPFPLCDHDIPNMQLMPVASPRVHFCCSWWTRSSTPCKISSTCWSTASWSSWRTWRRTCTTCRWAATCGQCFWFDTLFVNM